MTKRFTFFGLMVFLSLLFGFMLGHRPLSAPDEGRYAEISREMLETGDYITPRLNGVKYFEKPPLMYWLEASLIKIFGLSELSLRLLPALFGLFGCLLIYIVANRIGPGTSGEASAIVLSSSVLYYAHTRLLILDLGVSIFLSLSLFSFLLATQANSIRSQNKWLGGFYGGAAFAVLTKGVIGAVIPGTIILLWTIPWKRWNYLKLAFKPWGIFLFLMIAAPWHVLVSLKNPEFFKFYFIHEHFIRFMTPEHGRFQAWWFFIPILIGGLFPWVSFLPQSLNQARHSFSPPVFQFLIIWIGFIFLFFSFSHSKLIPYILPLFPPLSLILGAYIKYFWKSNKNSLDFVIGVQTFRLICMGILLGLPYIIYMQDLWQFRELRFLLYGLALLLLGGAIGPGFFMARGQVKSTIITLTSISIIIFIVLNAAWPLMEDRSIKSLALTFQRLKGPSHDLICYEKYYQDLPVYLNQTVKVAGWKGELSFGMEQEDTSAWMLTRENFWQIWQSSQTIYSILRKKTYENLQEEGYQMILVQETHQDVLIKNHS